jgi:hypothetical protein
VPKNPPKGETFEGFLALFHNKVPKKFDKLLKKKS